MKVLLVSPSKGALAQYAQYLASSLQEEGVTVNQISVFLQNFSQIPRLLVLLYRADTKLIHFNAHMLSWSDNLWLNGLASIFPLLLRSGGKKIILTLHNTPDSVDRKYLSRDYRIGSAAWLFGLLAVSFYARANRVCVTVEEYAMALARKYRALVSYVPHGVPALPPSRNTQTRKSVLAFGYISPTKDYETLFSAFARILVEEPGTRLIIAGGPHPHFPNSLESLRKKAKELNLPIEFTGFVPQDELPRLLSSMTLMVLPYLTTTGTSGAFHLAARYAKPVVASDIQEFKRLQRSGGGLLLYRNRDCQDLANRMLILLRSTNLILQLSQQNRIFAEANSMRETARQYLNIYHELM